MIVSTGSQLDRIVRCAASAALPQVIDANTEDRDDRELGTARHKYLERLPEVGREAALAEVDEKWRNACADIEIAKLADRLALSREVACAYNFNDGTARLLTPIAPRAYVIDPTCEIAFTIDLGGVDLPTVFVGDYKGPHGWLPAPDQSYQLGLAAVAFAAIYGATRANVEYIRLRDDGTPHRFNQSLDVFGLEATADKIQHTLRGLPVLRAEIQQGLVPDVTEGPWCRYCPAKQHCPAKTAQIRAVLATEAPLRFTEALTPELAARGYQMLRLMKSAVKDFEAALYAYGKTTPIPVGIDDDGSLRFFGELRRPGNEVLDGAIAHRVLTAAYDGETANAAVTMEVTKAAVTDAARKHLKPGEKITKVTEALIGKIRAAGGATRPITTTTIEYTVDPESGEAKARKRQAIAAAEPALTTTAQGAQP